MSNTDGLSELLKVVYDMLIENGQPLHVNAIALKAITSGKHFNLSQEALTKKINSALAVNVRKSRPHFVKAKHPNGKPIRGTYRAKNLELML